LTFEIGSMQGRLDLKTWQSLPCEGGLGGCPATGITQPVAHPPVATEHMLAEAACRECAT
jgi:hypothetical protein